MTERFGYISVVTDLASQETLGRLTVDYVSAIKRLGGEQWSAEDLTNPLPLFFLVVSGGTEHKILNLRAKRSQIVPDEPVFLLAHPGNNSLPASLEVLAKLQQDGQKGRILYLNGPDDERGLQQIQTAVRDLAVHHTLRQAQIGLVGEPSDWLVASSPDPATVQQIWGPEIVPLDLAELIRAAPEENLQAAVDSLVSAAAEVQEPSGAELADGVRVYAALKELAARYNLNALSVRCFDLVVDLKTTGCFALSQLTDEGIIAGCEGDLVSTVGMLWAYILLEQVPWMANPAQLDEADNTLWLAHCTVPRSIVQGYSLRSHFESGLGVGLQGTLPPGPATLLRIGGVGMDKLWLAEGEILSAGNAENLCRTQVKIRLTRGGRVADLLHAPLGNHLVLIRGHHAERLRNWWETFISQPGRD